MVPEDEFPLAAAAQNLRKLAKISIARQTTMTCAPASARIRFSEDAPHQPRSDPFNGIGRLQSFDESRPGAISNRTGPQNLSALRAPT